MEVVQTIANKSEELKSEEPEEFSFGSNHDSDEVELGRLDRSIHSEKSLTKSEIFRRRLSTKAIVRTSVSWKNLNYVVKTKTGDKHILDNVTGFVESGELLAIMGPSGSGKTTLLEAIASVIGGHSLLDPVTSLLGKGRGKVSGSIKINNMERTLNHKYIMQYVASNDTLMPFMTVYENLKYSCRFAGIPDKNMEKKIDTILADVGLTKCKYTIVGNDLVKGISHGQKRRLTLAVALTFNTPIILADEPTSGLDSASAIEIVSILKGLTRNGHTIACTIHQPATQIYNLFDRLYLISGGRTAYFENTKHLLPYFEKCGYSCPEFSNPSDFVLERVNQDFVDPKEVDRLIETYSKSEMARDAESLVKEMQETPSSENEKSWLSRNMKPRVNIFKQFGILLDRDFHNNYKNPSIFLIRLLSMMIIGAFTGYTFFGIGSQYTLVSQFNRTTVLFFCNVVVSLMSLLAVPSLLEERGLFYRERINGIVDPLPYCLSKFLSSMIPLGILALTYTSSFYFLVELRNFWNMVGIFYSSFVIAEAYVVLISTFTNFQPMGFLMGGTVAGIAMLYGRYFITPSQVTEPFDLHFMFDWSYFGYTFRALAVNELQGIKTFQNIPGYASGPEFLATKELDSSTIFDDCMINVYSALGIYFLYYLVMKGFHTGKK